MIRFVPPRSGGSGPFGTFGFPGGNRAHELRRREVVCGLNQQIGKNGVLLQQGFPGKQTAKAAVNMAFLLRQLFCLGFVVAEEGIGMMAKVLLRRGHCFMLAINGYSRCRPRQRQCKHQQNCGQFSHRPHDISFSGNVRECRSTLPTIAGL